MHGIFRRGTYIGIIRLQMIIITPQICIGKMRGITGDVRKMGGFETSAII